MRWCHSALLRILIDLGSEVDQLLPAAILSRLSYIIDSDVLIDRKVRHIPSRSVPTDTRSMSRNKLGVQYKCSNTRVVWELTFDNSVVAAAVKEYAGGSRGTPVDLVSLNVRKRLQTLASKTHREIK